MTVRQLRREMGLDEMVDWQGYRRYKAALEDQAREKTKMERKPSQRRRKR